MPTENDNGYTTPVLFEHAGRKALLVWGADHLTAHDAANGKVQSYMAAHAEVYRQEYRDQLVIIQGRIPRYLIRHVEADGGTIRPLEIGAGGEKDLTP